MIKNKQINWQWMYFFSLILFCVSFILNGMDENSLSKITFVMCLLLSLFAFYCYKTFVTNEKNICEIFVIYLFLFLFFSCAVLSPYSDKNHFRVIFIMGLAICVPFFTLLFNLWPKLRIHYIVNLCYKYRFIILICFIFFLLSIETLDDWAKLDSNTYYSYIASAKDFDFTLDTFELFKLGGHRAYGASFFYLIGEYLLPENPASARLVQIFCLFISVFSFSNILQELNLDNHKTIYNALLCALFAFSPLILGTIYSINIDFMMMCFWIWTVCCFLKKRWILFFCCSVLLILSKEVGICIYLGMIFGMFVYAVIKCRFSVKSMFSLLKVRYRRFVLYCLPVAVFAIIWLYGGKIWFSSNNSISIANTEASFNKFGISLVSIITKIKQITLLNFSWILTAVIIIALLVRIISFFTTKFKPVSSNNSFYFVLYGSYIFFLIFNFSYITYCHSRYIMPQLFVYVLLFSMAVKYLFRSNILKYFFLIIIDALMLIQSFITIDPITLSIFRNVNIGTHNMISTAAYTMVDGKVSTDAEVLSEREFSHYMEYNREYTEFGEAFEQALEEIHYDDKTLVLVESIYGFGSIDFSSIVMFGKEGGNSVDYYYDSDNNNIVYSSSYPALNLLFINQNTASNEIYALLNNYEKVYVISFPYNSSYEEFSTVDEFEYEDCFSVIKRGWQIDIRKLK